jgi:hypothetical protein
MTDVWILKAWIPQAYTPQELMALTAEDWEAIDRYNSEKERAWQRQRALEKKTRQAVDWSRFGF